MLTMDQIMGLAQLFNKYPLPEIEHQQFTFTCDDCTASRVHLMWYSTESCFDYERRWRVFVDQDVTEDCTTHMEWLGPWFKCNCPDLKLEGWYPSALDSNILQGYVTAIRDSLVNKVDSLLKPLAEQPKKKPKKKLFRVNMAETQYGTGYVWAWNSTDAYELGREYADNGDIDVDEQNTDVEVEEVDDPSDISPYEILNDEEDDDD